HVTRLATRLGFTSQKTAEKIEQDLIQLTPKKEWIDLPHLFIYHGRKVCKARQPMCEKCVIEPLCPSSTLKVKKKK
ncbi:MAG: endonuclease III domain-containing protein, partial [Blastocatellia bacterium]